MNIKLKPTIQRNQSKISMDLKGINKKVQETLSHVSTKSTTCRNSN